jgi:hypothetical protein
MRKIQKLDNFFDEFVFEEQIIFDFISFMIQNRLNLY